MSNMSQENMPVHIRVERGGSNDCGSIVKQTTNEPLMTQINNQEDSEEVQHWGMKSLTVTLWQAGLTFNLKMYKYLFKFY